MKRCYEEVSFLLFDNIPQQNGIRKLKTNFCQNDPKTGDVDTHHFIWLLSFTHIVSPYFVNRFVTSKMNPKTHKLKFIYSTQLIFISFIKIPQLNVLQFKVNRQPKRIFYVNSFITPHYNSLSRVSLSHSFYYPTACSNYTDEQLSMV